MLRDYRVSCRLSRLDVSLAHLLRIATEDTLLLM